MKNILMIAYHYPPENNGGTVRPFQFAKYLPKYGYNPIIITSDKSGITNMEDNIYRFEDNYSQERTFFKRIRRRLLYELGLISGNNIEWSKNVLDGIESVIKQESIDLILITYPPLLSLDIGVKLREKTSLPIVSDFRDGLVFEPLDSPSVLRSYCNKRIEKEIVELSNHIITVSPAITEYFKEEHEIDKVTTVTNGYDHVLEKNVYKKDNNNTMKIVYTGRLSLSYRGQNINSFIKTLRDVINEYPDKKIEFLFAGELSKAEESHLTKMLSNNFKYLGLLSRKETYQLQKEADLLLLVASEKRKGLATTKLYEYISVNRPILALTEGTFAEEVIQSTQTGICLNPDDELNIKQYVIKILKGKEIDAFTPNYEEIKKYHRDELTKQLALVLDKIIDGG